MFKLITLNYTVMLNGYSQWLNIQGKTYFIEISIVLISVMLDFNHKKEILKIYCLYVVCTSQDLRLPGGHLGMDERTSSTAQPGKD